MNSTFHGSSHWTFHPYFVNYHVYERKSVPQITGQIDDANRHEPHNFNPNRLALTLQQG